jgi:hypothetical protein
MKRPPDSIQLLMALSLIAVLVSGCRLPFPRVTDRPPPGPPSKVAQRAPQKNSAKMPSPRGAGAAGQAETAKIPRVGGAATQALSPVGPRLSALLARDELEKLTVGRIVFDPPGQMRAGVKEKIEARLADNLYEDLARSLKDLGMTNGDEIAAESSVRAALAGDGFEVYASSDGREAVRGGAFTPWIWDVTPLRSGDQSLALTVTVTTRIPGGADEKKDLPILTRTVTVSASSFYSTARFVKGNWPWIAAALLATALAGWLIRRQRI